MGTSNFHYENTSKAFAFTDETIQEFGNDYDYFIDWIQECFRDSNPYRLDLEAVRDPYELRNYSSRAVGEISKDVVCGMVCLTVSANIRVRSGYYSGACLDYDFNIDLGDYENIDPKEDDICNYFKEYVGVNKHWSRHHTNKVLKVMDEMKSWMEEKFSQLSTPLEVFAAFQNGETMYIQA